MQYKAVSTDYLRRMKFTTRISIIIVIILCAVIIKNYIVNKSEIKAIRAEVAAQTVDIRSELDEMKANRDMYKEFSDQLEDQIGELKSQLSEYKSMEAKNAKLFQELRGSKTSRGDSRSTKANMTRVTAYSLAYKDCGKSPGDREYGVTANGDMVYDWFTIAAGPGVPFGTKIYIPAFSDYPNGGVFTVTDRGGAIKNGCIDVFIRDTKVSDKFGVRYMNTYVINGGR
jgi:3D (Asp-Asp-Asp) domain-containing protein